MQKSLSEDFLSFAEKLSGQKVALLEIVEMVEVRGHSLLLIFLAFPFLLPIPVPGLSSIFGAMIAICGYRVAFGLPPWVPRSWLTSEISSSKVKKLFRSAAKILAKIEKLTKPRLEGLFRSKWVKPLDGFLLVLMGVILALPLPPGTNFPPALSILCMGIAMLERDGLFLFLSYFFFGLNVLLFGAIAFYGFEGVTRLFS